MIGALVPAARAGSLLLNSSSLLLLHEAAAAAEWLHNDTLSGPSGVAAVLGEAGQNAPRHLSSAAQAVITASYVLGVVGNAAALLILSREGRANGGSNGVGRNAGKHALMLRCLLCNDLVALLGMLVLMHLQLYLPPSLSSTRLFCAARVTMRLFGLGSGVVALVMAAERWLALSHPFLYQQHVTYHVIRRAIFSLWAGVVLLVCLPLLGFGLYYDEDEDGNRRCRRYRQATDPAGIAYAYVYFTFGSLVCLAIVCFNLAVMRVLCSIGRRSILDRRVSSRSTANQVHNASYRSLGQQAMTARHNAATHEELAFARLMAALCVIFVLCWMPQMLAIPLSRFAPKTQPLLRAADILMAFHFALDPYIYVLLRCRRRPCVQAVLKLLCRPLRPKTGSLRSLPATAEVNISLQDASRPRSSFTSSDVAVTPQIKRTGEPVSKDVSEHL